MYSTEQNLSHDNSLRLFEKISQKISQGSIFYISAGCEDFEWQEQPAFVRDPKIPCVGLLLGNYGDEYQESRIDACEMYKLGLYTNKLKDSEVKAINNLIHCSIEKNGICIVIDSISGELDYALMGIIKSNPESLSKICYIHNYGSFVPTIIKFQNNSNIVKNVTFLVDAYCFKKTMLGSDDHNYGKQLENYTLDELKWILHMEPNKTTVKDLCALQAAFVNHTTFGSIRAKCYNDAHKVFILNEKFEESQAMLVNHQVENYIKKMNGKEEDEEMKKIKKELLSFNVFFAQNLRLVVQQHFVHCITRLHTTCVTPKYQETLDKILNVVIDDFYQLSVQHKTIEAEQIFINTLQKLVRDTAFVHKYTEKFYNDLTCYTGWMGVYGFFKGKAEINPKKINSKIFENIKDELYKDILVIMHKINQVDNQIVITNDKFI